MNNPIEVNPAFLKRFIALKDMLLDSLKYPCPAKPRCKCCKCKSESSVLDLGDGDYICSACWRGWDYE